MDSYAVGAVAMANLLPSGEQLVAIPLGLAMGLDPITTLVVSLIVNCLVFFPVYFALKYFYSGVLSKIKFLTDYLERSRAKGKPYVDKYGVFGLAVLLALPGPLTGTYTATMISWLLGLDWRKAFIAVFVGSAVGGIIILIAATGVMGALKTFFSF